MEAPYHLSEPHAVSWTYRDTGRSNARFNLYGSEGLSGSPGPQRGHKLGTTESVLPGRGDELGFGGRPDERAELGQGLHAGRGDQFEHRSRSDPAKPAPGRERVPVSAFRPRPGRSRARPSGPD